MKYTKGKTKAGIMLKVWNDDMTEVLGAVGTIKQFEELGIIERVSRRQYSSDTYMCIPNPDRLETVIGYGATPRQAVDRAGFGKPWICHRHDWR